MRKSYKLLILMISILVMCTGCISQGKQENTESQEVVGTKWKKKLSDHILIDAELSDIVYPERKLYASYLFHQENLNFSEIKEIFFGQHSDDVLKTEGDEHHILLETSTNEYALSTMHKLSYVNQNTRPTGYLFEIYLDEQSSPAPLDNSDLTDDFIARGKKVLEDLGYEYFILKNPSVFSFTHDQINQIQEKLYQQELEALAGANPLDEMEKSEDPAMKDYWQDVSNRMQDYQLPYTAEDDTFYVLYAFEKDGLPLYSTYFSVPVSVNIEGLRVGQVYAKQCEDDKGFWSFEAEGITGLEKVEEKEIISLDKAQEKLVGLYENIFLNYDLFIRKIYLEYIPMPIYPENTSSNLNYKLVPYWCFVLEREDGYLYADRINAYTGEDLAYGG